MLQKSSSVSARTALSRTSAALNNAAVRSMSTTTSGNAVVCAVTKAVATAPTAMTSKQQLKNLSGGVFISQKLNEASTPKSTETMKMLAAVKVYQMVRAYQSDGYLFAKTNPLDLQTAPYMSRPMQHHVSKIKKMHYTDYGFTDEDLDKTIDCRIPGYEGFLCESREPVTLRILVKRLEETYCGPIGVEYSHISDPEVRKFMRKRFETPNKIEFSKQFRLRILHRAIRAQSFENFIHSKFPTTKRFGLDGCESMIVATKEITKRASSQGVDSVVIGMPHRGRLNLLMNVMHKPMQQIVGEFRGMTGFGTEDWGSIGDVKYHMGVEFEHWDVDSERNIHMTVLPNPSHLEAIDPMVLGHASAQQYYNGDHDHLKTLPIIFHGDASIAGQGVVYETLQMSQLPAYNVGGTVHIVVNNQVGFTTNVADAGSGKACTSIARAVDAPIFHVNGDDPEAVTYVAQVAFDYRQQFGGDVFIDLIGYRRFGHNEQDMPKFTQPAMYGKIDNHPAIMDIYSKRVMEDGVCDKTYVEKTKKDVWDFYTLQYDKVKTYEPKPFEYPPNWKSMARPGSIVTAKKTGVPVAQLKELGLTISKLPKTLTPHPNLAKLYDARVKALESGNNVDFGLAEALAYGSLLKDGYHVRIAGQDVQRGTFSHRHSVLHDQKNPGQTYSPLKELKTPHKFEAHNSHLSEYAALGFEFGYAMTHPNTLSIWEAQFGDFCNGAQIVIDQFISSGEAKWGTQNAITMLLPHGYDGMGPEHSSARVERFLQLCDDREEVIHPDYWIPEKKGVIQKHNLQVVMPSTPSQHFHVLRRQLIRGFRKPLIVFSPKKLLKLRSAVSDLSEMGEDTMFRPYIPDVPTKNSKSPSQMKRLILCTGQVYYDLVAHREKTKSYDVAIARVEQLSPFPFDSFIDDLKQYTSLRDVCWVQEEPMNQGAWNYVSQRIASSLAHVKHPISRAIYMGRDVSGSPAAGDLNMHKRELDQLLTDAFDHTRSKNSYYERHMS